MFGRLAEFPMVQTDQVEVPAMLHNFAQNLLNDDLVFVIFKPSWQEVALDELHHEEVLRCLDECWSHSYLVSFRQHSRLMEQVWPVGINPADFQRNTLTVSASDDNYTDITFAEDRQIESVRFSRHLNFF